MEKKTLIITIFLIFIIIFSLLLSYKIALIITKQTLEQKNTIEYLQDKAILKSNYNEKEISHLEDVQKLLNIINYLFYLSLLFCSLIVTYYRKDKKFIKKLFFLGGIGIITTILILIFSSLISFHSTFVFLHKIFFPQGNWSFPVESLLIKTFPLDFFISISVKIFLFDLILGSIFILLYFYLKNVR